MSIVWLRFLFDIVNMMVTLSADKLKNVLDLVTVWFHKHTANLHDLRVMLGKLVYVAQVLSPCMPLF